MPQDKIDLLYKDLQGEYDLGSIDDFKSYLSDNKKRELFFNEIVKPRYDVTDIGVFEDTYGLKKKEPAIGLGYGSLSEASRMGGLPKQEKPSVLKTAATTTPSVSTKKAEIKLQPLNIEQIKAATTKSTADIGKPDVPKQVIPKTEVKATEGSIADLSIKKQKYTDELNLANQEYLRLEQEYAPIMEELEVLGKEYEATQDPELAKQYNNLYLQAKPALDKMKMFSENEKVLSSNLRNVEQLQDANYEKNYGVGSMVKRGFGNTVANIVNSTGKIIETFGDLAAQTSFAAAYAPEALAQEDDKLTDQLARDIDEYYKRINEAVNKQVPKSFASYSPLSDKPSAAKLLDFGINAFAQLAPTVVAGLTTGGVGAAAMGFTMEFGGVYDTFHDPIKQRYIKQGLSEKEAEAKADLEAGLMSTGVAMIIGQLDKFGATEMINAASKKMLAKKITQDALTELGEKTGKEAAETAIKKSLVQNLASFGKGYGKAVLPEVITEPIQELVAPAAADVYEATTGEEIFEEGLGNKQTWINAGNSSIGALMASSPGGVVGGASSVTTQGYRKAVSMKDPAEFDKFNAILTAEVESGLTTPEQAQEALDVIQKVQIADKQIPSTIQNEVERTAAANLLIEKQNITDEIDGKDASLVAPQKERLKAIDSALNDIATGKFIEQLTKQDEQRGIEEPISAGTDVLEEGVGMAVEPGKEGVAGEDIQAEEVLEPAKPSENISTAADSKGVYIKDGEYGFIRTEGQLVVFETNDKIIDLGNKDELAETPISEFGIEKEELLDVQVNEDNSVVVEGVKFVNNFSNPQAAINTDANGNVVSVNLETEDGKKRTIRGQRAEEIAYQYKLKEFEQNATEESIARLEQEVTRLEEEAKKPKPQTKKRSTAKRKPKEVVSEKVTEVTAPAIEVTPTAEPTKPAAKAEPTKEAAKTEAKKSKPEQIGEGLLDALGLEPVEPAKKAGKKKPVNVSNKSELSELEGKAQGDKKTIIEAAKKAIATLKSVFPDMEIYIHEDTDSYNETMSDVGGVANSRGNFAFERDANDNPTGRGRIDINLSNAKDTTVAHELVHAVLLKAFGDNPAVFKALRDRMSKILRADLNEQVTAFEKLYAGQDVAPEEYLTELAALLSQGGETVEYKPSTLRKVAALINEFVSRITKGKFQPFKSEVDFINFVGFLNQVSGAISEGGVIEQLNTQQAYSDGRAIQVPADFKAVKYKSEKVSKSQIGDYTFPSNIEILKISNLPIKTLEEVVKQYKGRVVIITSDATGYGVDSDGEPILGGAGFASNKINVNDGIGFASLNEGTVKGTYTRAEKAYGFGKTLVLIMVQPPHTTINNSYGAKYMLRGLLKIGELNATELEKTKNAIKNFVIKSKSVQEEFKSEAKKARDAEELKQAEIEINKLKKLKENGKVLTKEQNAAIKKYDAKIKKKEAEGKVEEVTKQRATQKALFELLDKIQPGADLNSLIKEFLNITTFTLRKEIGLGILPSSKETRTDKRTTYSKIAFNNINYSIYDFLKEYGDKTILTEDMMLNNKGGVLVGGFELDVTEVEQREKLIKEIQSKGILHPLFNAKLPGKNHFRLDDLYGAQENFGKYAVPDKVIDEDKIGEDELGDLVRKIFTLNSDYEPKFRSIPLNERTYTHLKIANKTKLKDEVLAPKGFLKEKEADVAVKVAKGEGFIPLPGAAEQMAKATMVSKSQVDVYHGSPYDFDKFTTEKIGTGEGAQAFGWGLYFTDLESIARNYAETLGGRANIYAKLRDAIANDDNITFYANSGEKVKISKDKYGDYTIYEQEGSKETDLNTGLSEDEIVEEFLNQADNRYSTKGEFYVNNKDVTPKKVLYKVSLHEGKSPSEYTWLIFDKPVSSEVKNKIIKQIEKENANPETTPFTSSTSFLVEKINSAQTGGEMYSILSGLIYGDKNASLFLLNTGIDGIKYPAESISRGATSETARGFNYVVFDENAVTIKSKAQKAQTDKIKDFIDAQRKAGQSDKDIKAGLELVADKVGLTAEDINKLMGVESDEAKPLKGFKPKDKAAKEAEDEQGTEEIINSDNTLQSVPKLEAPVPPTQNEFEETKKAFEEANEVFPDVTDETDADGIKTRVKSIIDAFINNSNEFDTRTKQELNDRLGRFYDVLSFDKLEQIGNEFIEQLGGIDKAVLIASDGTKDIPPFVRTFVLGQAIINAKKEYKNAKTEAEKNKRLDDQIRYSDLLDTTSRAYGQANAYIARFYELDPIAVVRKIKRKVQERNELVEPTAKKKAAEIKKLIEEEGDFTEAINEALEEALEGTQATVDGVQKEIDNLRKEIAKKSGKKYKRYPVNLGVTKDQVIAARKRIFGSAYSNPFLNPEFWKDALILAADAIQEGAVKINDFYDYMNITLKGKYSEAYGEIYQRAKGLAVEKGANESDFSTNEEVQEELDRISKESDAKKIAKLTALRAKAAAKREQNASKILADKIIKDANKELDNATTQKEKDAISKIIQVLAKKAKEATTANNKPKSQSLSDLITFVLSQAKKGEEIWKQAQKEVFESIDNDKTLSDDKKLELKDFLDNYRKTIFDVLLTRGQKDKIIKEKLIELGYAKQVGNKTVFNVDDIIAGTKSTQEAIDALITKISEETGISEQDLSDLKQAFKTRLDDIIVEKKKAKVDAYLKQKERYRAARLINNRTRKTRVQKLIELYNAGGLTNDAVKNELAEELGLVSFTEQDEAFLNKKLQEADDAPSGAEREKIEEEIQAYLEVKDADYWLKEVAERWRARLLSGFLTAIKNLGGFYDTATMLLQQTIFTNIQSLAKQGTLDKNVLKVVRDARKAALYTATDIFLNGGVDMGNAFSELTGSKEGTPRVRYIEYWKPFFNPTSWKNPLKLRNKLKESEKFIGRTLSFFDTINQVLLQETKTYTYLKDMYIRSGYSAKDASQKAYDAMNSVSIIEATNQATNEFEKRGIALDMTKKADKARFNRRVYEIVQQSREKEATKAGVKFANRYTYKSYDTGIMQPVAATLSSVKNLFSQAAAKIRKNAKDYGINYKVADTVAKSIEFLGDDIFMVYLPFIKGVANILEKGLELNPYYGLTKSAAYLGVGAGAGKDFKQEYYQRSGEYLFRAVMGLAITSLLLSLADDEDEENKKLFGAGQEDFRKQAASKVLRPANTIVIGGRRINLDYLGSYGISLKIDAAFADLKRYDKEYNKLEGSDKYQAQIMAALSTILYSGYTQAIYEAIAPNKEKRKIEQEVKMKGSELLTRATIPFANTSRQLYGMIDPQAKKPISMAEYIAKYSGVVAGWTLDRPNFDYRGRTFNTGQVYSSSPDAFIAMFKETAALADEVDEFIQKGTKGDFSFTTIRKRDEKYFIMDKETSKMREMTDYEYYDVSLAANKKFNKEVTDFYNKYKNSNYKNDSERRFYESVVGDPVLLKKAITYMNSSAKKEAFYETFGYVPGTIEQDLINNNID